MSGRESAHVLGAGVGAVGGEPGSGSAPAAASGGPVARALRSHQLWLTVGYVAVLLLLAQAYA
ncbi:MAG TPA: hypothetical protein VIN04_08575 [Myxococcota bacterium]